MIFFPEEPASANKEDSGQRGRIEADHVTSARNSGPVGHI